MKTLICRMFTALLVVTAFSGCASPAKQESAIEWMERHPNYLDP
jgi:hypothetical protein